MIDVDINSEDLVHSFAKHLAEANYSYAEWQDETKKYQACRAELRKRAHAALGAWVTNPDSDRKRGRYNDMVFKKRPDIRIFYSDGWRVALGDVVVPPDGNRYMSKIRAKTLAYLFFVLLLPYETAIKAVGE